MRGSPGASRATTGCSATSRTRADSTSSSRRWPTRSPTSIVPMRRELERLEEAALFNGEYDAGDAVVTLQSGTGGTDAQDWTEMMLRMYERWSRRPRLRERTARGEPRRGGGPEERDLHRPRRERLRHPQGRARQAPAGAASPLRRGAPPADLVRHGDRRAASARERDRDQRGRSEDRHVPRAGSRRPARQQDRQRGADHPSTDRHRRAVPERALAVGQQAGRDARAEITSGRRARRSARR